MLFFRTPFFLPLLYPRLIWRVPTEGKEIYLSFDDGPVAGPTEFVLDELEKVQGKATFFCVGDNVVKHPQSFKRILSGGHAIGNHTFNHLNGWRHSVEDYVSNISLCKNELIRNGSLSGGKLKGLFRPPYGRIRPSQIRALSEYEIVMWDVLSFDYSEKVSPQLCLNGAVAATRRGSIVVFHDSHKSERNLLYALPRYLSHFSSLGYSFKAIPIQ